MAKLTADFPLLSIEDQPGMSLRQMAEQMDNYAETMSRRPEMVFIDYLELVRAGPALGPGEAVDKVSRALKDFSREHDVALIVLHQTNAMESSRIRNSGSKVQDNGHLALTRRAARYGGDVAADYTVGCYRPALDPEMAEHIRAMADPQFMMQLLKNRGGSQLYLTGVEHHVDTRFWKISERQAPIEEPHARHQGAWQP